MRQKSSKNKILVTGGAGFIGSALVRQAVCRGYRVVVVDKLTYAGDLARLAEVRGDYDFVRADIVDGRRMERIFRDERPAAVIHLAAETHVDRSIRDAAPFIAANVAGTQILLDCCRKFVTPRILHISTDEVYGDIKKGRFKESAPLAPNSPYAASKAAADLLVRSYVRTYGLPAIIVRPSNNYGPWQYPEKLLPVVIVKALQGKRVPVYARGANVREWLHVDDCARAILTVLEKGRCGEVYNVGSGQVRRNIEVVRMLLRLLDKPQRLIKFVDDRPGHDIRYALDFSKIRALGWQPAVSFDGGSRSLVSWSLAHRVWLESKVVPRV